MTWYFLFRTGWIAEDKSPTQQTHGAVLHSVYLSVCPRKSQGDSSNVSAVMRWSLLVCLCRAPDGTDNGRLGWTRRTTNQAFHGE